MKHRKGLTWLTELPIAHRGLHDADLNRPENSMAAFRAAVDGPFAIECDLHPSADCIPMVFHDDDLERMTGTPGNIRDRQAADLTRLSLAGSAEGIPTLADLLEMVSGAVPLILELKSQSGRDKEFAAAVCDLLEDYPGPAAIMSFDPDLIADGRARAPALPRGLVAEGNWRVGWFVIKSLLRTNAHFLSYSIDDLPTPGPLVARFLFGLPLICWTVRTDAQRRLARLWTGQMTFEGFVP